MLKIWKKRKYKQGQEVGKNFVATSSIEECMEKLRKFTFQGNKETPFNKGMIDAIENGLQKKMADQAKKAQLEKEMIELKEKKNSENTDNRLNEIEEIKKVQKSNSKDLQR